MEPLCTLYGYWINSPPPPPPPPPIIPGFVSLLSKDTMSNHSLISFPTLSLIMHRQCVPPLSPSRAARGKTRGFDVSLIKRLYLGAELLIKSPYFLDSTVNNTTDIWLSDHLQTCLEPTQVEGGYVKCPTLGEGPFINPLVKAPHRPRRGIVGDLIDKCIIN